LITVVGAPGIGTTRLCIELAAALRPAGWTSWFVDLSDARTTASLCRAGAEALNLPLSERSLQDSARQVGKALANRQRALLILDNFEQLTAVGATVVAGWRSQAPDLVVVVRNTRSWWADALGASNSLELAERASCDVLVVHPPLPNAEARFERAVRPMQ
jgi:nucleotide-binding universal stress UspA family protein